MIRNTKINRCILADTVFNANPKMIGQVIKENLFMNIIFLQRALTAGCFSLDIKLIGKSYPCII